MPRKARMIIEGDTAVYHVVSRTALTGYVLGDVEKDFLISLIRHLSKVYFAEVLGFCLMGNHFHLVARMQTGDDLSDDKIRNRFELYYGKDNKKILMDGQIPSFRSKWASLSEYIKEIKQGFSRYYNRRHKRKGFFWSDRFKSVIIENGDALLNCLAYVDLNPVRAGIAERPEDYRWSSLGYHMQAGNKVGFLSLDFGFTGKRKSKRQRLQDYRRYVYEKGSLASSKGKEINSDLIANEIRKDFEIGKFDRFRFRTRYFTDSGIIGSKKFVERYYEMFRADVDPVEKKPKAVKGLQGIYSLKRLSELI